MSLQRQYIINTLLYLDLLINNVYIFYVNFKIEKKLNIK